MKTAGEPASSSPRPCASLEKPHESFQFAAPCGPRRKKNERGQISAFPQKPPGWRFRFSRTGVSPPLARQRSNCPPPSPNLVRTHMVENYQALRDSAPCLSRAAILPKATKLAWKRRTPENTILSQPYCRCVSSDRPNREGCQLAASLEGEPGPAPAGKTLPYLYPETRFRRERARGMYEK